MAKGRPEIDVERCKGCALCLQVCPEEILRQAEEFNRQGHRYAECFAPERCTACLACAIICPDMAIRIWRYVGVK